MAKLGESFRDFELGGWEDESVCSDYDEHLSTVTIQSVGALLDAAGVRQGSLPSPEARWSLWVYGLGCARECGGHRCDLRRHSSSRLARRRFTRGTEFLSVQRSGTQQAGRH